MSSHTNVDHDELNKFSSIASRWWDPESEFRPLHQINPLRVDYIEQCAGGLFGKRACDVGCGGGLVSEAMAQRGAEVTGIDMAEASLQVARLHSLESGIKVDYQHCSTEAFAEQHPQQFDLVTCLEMLEHVPDPQAIVAACCQLVKPGGHLLVSTLNRTFKGWLFGVVAAEQLLKLVPAGTHDYNKFLKPSEILRWTDAQGMRVQGMTGLHHNPLTGRFWLDGRNVDVNYLLHLYKPEDC